LELARTAWEAAKIEIGNIKDMDSRASSLSLLGSALAQAQQWEQAQVVIDMIEDRDSASRNQAWALRDLGGEFARAQQWEQAQAVRDKIEDSEYQAEVLIILAKEMVLAGQYEQVLRWIQYYWQQTVTKKDALQLFPMALPLIISRPEIGDDFYKTFLWVDTILRG
jgi:hypothetical protein